MLHWRESGANFNDGCMVLDIPCATACVFVIIILTIAIIYRNCEHPCVHTFARLQKPRWWPSFATGEHQSRGLQQSTWPPRFSDLFVVRNLSDWIVFSRQDSSHWILVKKLCKFFNFIGGKPLTAALLWLKRVTKETMNLTGHFIPGHVASWV